MRPEKLYLTDIVDAASAVRRFITGVSEDAFMEDELVRSAVLQKLIVIGEAAGRLPDGLKERYPTVPWSKVVAFRNILIHEYFAIDWEIVWVAACEDVPVLAQSVQSILAGEYSGTT